jgi:simple sugar transport system substrate-binding protein
VVEHESKNSIKQAGEDYGVTVDYRNPPSGDLADMARLIEQAAAAGYDGVIVTIADYDVLQGAIGKVTAKKNSADYDQLGYSRAE